MHHSTPFPLPSSPRSFPSCTCHRPNPLLGTLPSDMTPPMLGRCRDRLREPLILRCQVTVAPSSGCFWCGSPTVVVPAAWIFAQLPSTSLRLGPWRRLLGHLMGA
uniref:Uncharacterized protein n=1 Tax=Oryza sativa subsp. japonica TaxID=39947 RepID=Q6YVH0_ORYSJ|nr:hypothetical protein [Oryza sativa Japonica Group]BAD17635.1 hypothetical protein [Oryza sativa Japonica Group]